MVGLKHPSGLDTANWAFTSRKPSSEGQHLVILIDEDCLRILETFGMHPFVGCEKLTF